MPTGLPWLFFHCTKSEISMAKFLTQTHNLTHTMRAHSQFTCRWEMATLYQHPAPTDTSNIEMECRYMRQYLGGNNSRMAVEYITIQQAPHQPSGESHTSSFQGDGKDRRILGEIRKGVLEKLTLLTIYLKKYALRKIGRRSLLLEEPIMVLLGVGWVGVGCGVTFEPVTWSTYYAWSLHSVMNKTTKTKKVIVIRQINEK